MLKVCKFGGTSMASAETIKKVKDIVLKEDDRAYIVVSAPGKRDKNDIKVTDTLYACNEEAIKTGSCAKTFALIKNRFREIVKDLGLKLDIEEILDRTEKEINDTKSADFAASRGEYLSAVVAAEYFGFEFVDADEMIRFDSHGRLNQDYTNDKVQTRLADVKRAVIPVVYGS